MIIIDIIIYEIFSRNEKLSNRKALVQNGQ